MSPLVIVLEGPNGTGKTTLSRLLHQHALSKLVGRYGRVHRHRAFEHALAGTPEAREICEPLKSAFVPVNTHVDDFYVADAIQRFCYPEDVVILDRSFPSGVAYARAGIERSGTVTGESRAILAADQRARDATPAAWKSWLKSWSDLIPRRLYVTLQVTHATGRARTAERTRWYPTPEQHAELEKQFLLIHSFMEGPRVLIDTETRPVSEVLESIIAKL